MLVYNAFKLKSKQNMLKIIANIIYIYQSYQLVGGSRDATRLCFLADDFITDFLFSLLYCPQTQGIGKRYGPIVN